MLIFVAGAAMAYGALGRGTFSAWWLAIPTTMLLSLGARLQRLETQGAKLSRAVEFYNRALARLDGHWAGRGETGARFFDERHLYAQDLDIFGDASLFEFLCSARTRTGEETLAGWLLSAAPPDMVIARQQAILEVAPRLDLREDLALAGDSARSGVHAEALIAWGEGQPVLEPSPFRAVAWGVSAIGAVAVIFAMTYLLVRLGILDLPERTMAELRIYSLAIGILCLGVHWRFKNHTARIIQDVDKAGHDLGLLTALLQRLETEECASPRLAALRAQLVAEGRPASWRIAQLNRLVELLDFRRSGIMKLIGPLLLWNLHLCYAIEDWRRASGPAIRRWLSAVGEMEAIASLASYCYEHPSYVFPELVTESPFFQAEALGHPLLTEDRVVPNDTCLGHELRALVVSGSNMSGKSTLLRTIGINAVLAQAGAPVCARRLQLSSLAVGVHQDPRLASGGYLAFLCRDFATEPDHGKVPHDPAGTISD